MKTGILGPHARTWAGKQTFRGGIDVSDGLAEFGNAVGSFNQNGDSYFVDPTNGSNGFSGKTPGTAKKTLAAGESILVANQNDKLYYLAGSSSLSLAETLTWDKSYTHLIGVCAPTNIAQRARVFMTEAVADTPMLTVSGTGCSMSNVYFFHGIDDAAALVGTNVTGGRCYFGNVHFAGIGHATQGDEANAVSLSLAGAEECMFEGCTIGVDTVNRSAANTEIECSAAAVRNTFKDCMVLSVCDSADHTFVRAASGGLDRWLSFENTKFLNAIESGSTTMTAGVNIHNTAGGFVLIDDRCIMIGTTDVNTDDNANVFSNGVRAAATSILGLTITK